MLEAGKQIVGYWWNPSTPEKQYFGVLKIFDDSIRLDIVFSQSQILAMEQQSFIHGFNDYYLPVIHGCCGGASRKEYSLINATINSNEYPDFFTFSFGNLPVHVSQIYEGVYIKDLEENFISSAIIRTNYLSEWIPPPTIKESYCEADDSFDLKYSNRSNDFLLFTDEKINIKFSSYLSGRKNLGNNFSYTIFNDATININSKEKLSYKSFSLYLFKIKTFLWLLMGKANIISDIKFCYLIDAEHEIPSEIWIRNDIVEENNNKPLFPFESIKDLQNKFTQWSDFIDSNFDTINMLMQITERPSTFFADRKTENLVQIFEALSDFIIGKDIPIGDSYFKFLVTDSAAIKKYDKKKTSPVLISKLAYFFWEKHFDLFESDFDYIYGTHDESKIIEFLSNAKDIRVKYSHGGKEKNITLKPECINVILYKGIRFILLHDILGIEIENIRMESI